MSKTRDNTPEMDYFELRRRHEESKRARMASQVQKNPVEERLEHQVAQQRKPMPEVTVEETPVNDVQDELKLEVKPAPVDAFEEAIEENYEAFDDDMDYDTDEEAVNPNPFDPFLRFFSGMKANMASRRNKGDELEDIDLDDLTDEELAELEAEELEEDSFEEAAAPVKSRFNLRRSAQPDEAIEEDIAVAADIEDINDTPVRAAVRNTEEYSDEDFDEDYEDEDYEDFDEEDLPRKSGFKKFVNLFVTRIDEDEEYEEEVYEDEELEDADFDDEDLDDIEEVEEVEEEPVRKGFFSRGRKNKAHRFAEDEEVYDDLAPEIQIRPEGGHDKMDDMNKLANETAAQAAGIETSGMTRRERRELAMRIAAEEAARKAEEAAAAPVEPLFTDSDAKEAPVDMAAFENAPKTDLIVETTVEEIIETVDEPTREFTPVRDVQFAAEKAIFTVDDEDDDDEDEDDEDEIIEKKPRRGLFGRKRVKDEEDDFDDEDEDDEDYDDEDDDEEEIIEKKPRRGLFGRKRAKDEEEDDFDDEDEGDEDDEDDEDLDDEYDDEDDDEYDEYDDDEEDDYDDDDDDEYDDYDDDDDEPRRSFGHHLIGVFKIILALILILLVLVIGLNFHYFITGENAIVTKAHEVLGDSSASEVLCFGYVMRESMPAEEATAPEVVIETEITAEPTALPQAEAVIPDLGSNGAITETPVVEVAPVVEAAPAVQEVPATSGSIG